MSNEYDKEIFNGLEEFDLSEFEASLIDYSMTRTQGYSEFQMQNFVINPAITDYRKMDQVMLELDSRAQVERTLVMELKINLINIDLKKEDIVEFDGRDGHKKLLELDLERLEYDFIVNKKRHRQARNELKTLSNLVSKSFDNKAEVVSLLEDNKEEKEAHYWVTRMAKQAAMDMISTGRIGVGNMDAIAGMPEEKQVETLATALQYNQRLSIGMNEINQQVSDELLKLGDSLPKFDVPSITDKLLIDDVVVNKEV
jgi:hypothetical protein